MIRQVPNRCEQIAHKQPHLQTALPAGKLVLESPQLCKFDHEPETGLAFYFLRTVSITQCKSNHQQSL